MSSPTGPHVQEIERPVRILIADDHQLIRKMVRSTLEQHRQFDVVGEASDGARAVEETARLKPDVVILNITMPVLNGFEAARTIKATLPETAIVILSSHADQCFIEEAREIGVQAYVPKTQTVQALVKAIETAVLGGDFVLIE